MRICSIDTETLSKTHQLNKCIFHLGKEELLATSSVITPAVNQTTIPNKIYLYNKEKSCQWLFWAGNYKDLDQLQYKQLM